MLNHMIQRKMTQECTRLAAMCSPSIWCGFLLEAHGSEILAQSNRAQNFLFKRWWRNTGSFLNGKGEPECVRFSNAEVFFFSYYCLFKYFILLIDIFTQRVQLSKETFCKAALKASYHACGIYLLGSFLLYSDYLLIKLLYSLSFYEIESKMQTSSLWRKRLTMSEL